MLEDIPRYHLANLPTPLHRLLHLEESLGLNEIWIKRDDLTGLSFGGNKTRKLEYVVGKAMEDNADTLVTVGALQSNHCRQTAAAAAVAGLRCILLLAGEEPDIYEGNLLLDMLLGAELKFFPDDDFSGLSQRLDIIIGTLQDLGLKPHRIPAGAAYPLGSLAYVKAMKEVKSQFDEVDSFPDRIILASGTAGTISGMLVGAHLMDIQSEIIAVTVMDKVERHREKINNLLAEMQTEYEFIPEFTPDFSIDDRFLGEGYSIMSDGVKSSIEMFAKMDAILLDPVYTGRAAMALIRMALAGEIDSDEKVLFWHTGGTPSVFTESSSFM